MKDEQKHVGMILDSCLNFNSHVREKIISARRGIGAIRYLSKYVSRVVLDHILIMVTLFIIDTTPNTTVNSILLKN